MQVRVSACNWTDTYIHTCENPAWNVYSHNPFFSHYPLKRVLDSHHPFFSHYPFKRVLDSHHPFFSHYPFKRVLDSLCMKNSWVVCPDNWGVESISMYAMEHREEFSRYANVSTLAPLQEFLPRGPMYKNLCA